MNTPKEDKKWSVVHEAIEQQDNMKPVKLKDKGYTKEKEVNLSLKDFIDELDEMAAEWDLFGGALGIPVKVLDRIQDSNGLGRYMTGMLKVWLGTGKATWEQLKEALIREGNWRLAEKIEKYRKEDLKEQQKRKEQNLKDSKILRKQKQT